MSQEAKEVVGVHNLSFSYGKTSIISSGCLTVKQGELNAIIGPNGSGKTTLLKLMMGFLEPTKGTIEIFGKEPKKAREYIGYVPQSQRFDSFFPLSVFELVLSGSLSSLPWYGRYPQNEKKQALEIMATLEIDHLKERQFGSLSGGQAQRALIARALQAKPKLLLLDEPTANIDMQAEGKIYELIKSLGKDISILMVTHDLDTVLHDVDTVFCMQGDIATLKPSEVCKHFGVGLYHKPLKEDL